MAEEFNDGASSSNSSKNCEFRQEENDLIEDFKSLNVTEDVLHTQSDEPLPPFVLHDVPHIRQRYNWDCGVSCVLMLLSDEQRHYFMENFHSICNEEGFGQSTWTIDLCYLLKRFNIPHTMYTKMPGVREEFKYQKFYAKNFEKDRTRVTRRFAQAASSGISVVSGILSTQALQRHLATHGPAIALVDAGLLACRFCKRKHISAALRRWFGGGYSGHYILIIGYDSASDTMLYRDPAAAAGGCGARGGLRGARGADGTDHDLVLVYR